MLQPFFGKAKASEVGVVPGHGDMHAQRRFSMLCGNMDCDESFRASTYNVPRWCAVALSLAGTSIVLARPPKKAKNSSDAEMPR